MSKKSFNLKNKIIAATPLLCLFAFLALGFFFGKWHPGWLVFLLIPVMPYLLGKKKLRFSIPLIITIVYFILGFGWHLWHPAWIIFILIPVFEIFFGPSKNKGDSSDND